MVRAASHIETAPERTSTCSEEIGGPVGPVSATPPPPKFRPLVIGSKREAALRSGTLHLRLALSEVPGRPWVEAFNELDQARSPFDALAKDQLPKIDGNMILWSVRQGDLMPAWWYIGRCVDRANAACARRAHAQARTESREASERARLPELSDRTTEPAAPGEGP